MAYLWLRDVTEVQGPWFSTVADAGLSGALRYYAAFPNYGPYTSTQSISPVPNTDYGIGFAQWDVVVHGTPKLENNYTGYGYTIRVHGVEPPAGMRYRLSAIDQNPPGYSFSASPLFGSIAAAAAFGGGTYFYGRGIGSYASQGAPSAIGPGRWSVTTTSTTGARRTVTVYAEGAETGGVLLPAITLPAGLPCWLAVGHGVELMPVYAETQMRTGHARKRRIYLSAPRVVTVELHLSAVHAPIFWAWYEHRLRAGQEAFSTRVPNQGPGMLWWRAQFVEPPEYTALPRGMFRLRAKLLLTGSGSETGPVLSSSLATVARLPFAGSVALTVGKPLATLASIAFGPVARLRALARLPFVAGPPPIYRVASVAETGATGEAVSAVWAAFAGVTDAAVASESIVVGSSAGASVSDSATTSDSATLPAWTPAALFTAPGTDNGFTLDFTNPASMRKSGGAQAAVGDQVVSLTPQAGSLSSLPLNATGPIAGAGHLDFVQTAGGRPIFTMNFRAATRGGWTSWCVLDEMDPTTLNGNIAATVDGQYANGTSAMRGPELISTGVQLYSWNTSNSAYCNMGGVYSRTIGERVLLIARVDATTATVYRNSAVALGTAASNGRLFDGNSVRFGIAAAALGNQTYSYGQYPGKMRAVGIIDRPIDTSAGGELDKLVAWANALP